MICQHFLVVLFCFCCAASAAALPLLRQWLLCLLLLLLQQKHLLLSLRRAWFIVSVPISLWDSLFAGRTLQRQRQRQRQRQHSLSCWSCPIVPVSTADWSVPQRVLCGTHLSLSLLDTIQNRVRESERERARRPAGQRALLASTELRNQNKCDEKPACLFVFACLLRCRCRCCCPACLPTRPTARQAAVDALPTLAVYRYASLPATAADTKSEWHEERTSRDC